MKALEINTPQGSPALDRLKLRGRYVTFAMLEKELESHSLYAYSGIVPTGSFLKEDVVMKALEMNTSKRSSMLEFLELRGRYLTLAVLDIALERLTLKKLAALALCELVDRQGLRCHLSQPPGNG